MEEKIIRLVQTALLMNALERIAARFISMKSERT